jgi:hypothetical protein
MGGMVVRVGQDLRGDKVRPGGYFFRKVLGAKKLPWDYFCWLTRKYGKPRALSSNAPAYF